MKDFTLFCFGKATALVSCRTVKIIGIGLNNGVVLSIKVTPPTNKIYLFALVTLIVDHLTSIYELGLDNLKMHLRSAY